MTPDLSKTGPAASTLHIEAAGTERDTASATWRGWCQRCPSCGTGRLYGRYLKVVDRCATCSTELHHQRADDAPPYFTMFIVCHIVVGGVLSMEQSFHPPTWVQMVVWLPITLLLSLWLLPRVKGLLIGYQWALRMHGFALDGPDPAAPAPKPIAVGDSR